MALSLKHTPLLRILIPYVFGISVSCVVEFSVWLWCSLILISCFTYIAIKRALRNPLALYNYNFLFSAPLFFVILSLGALSAQFHTPQKLKLTEINGQHLQVEITEIKVNDYSMLIDADIISQIGYGARVRLLTQGVNYNIKEGDRLLFKSNLSSVRNIDSTEFDYEQYLFHNGIIYNQIIEIERLQKVGTSATIKTRLKLLQRSIIHVINSSRLNNGTRHFITAILLGERNYIDRETRNQFSNAGVAHILALSGLHISIIISILWYLLFPLDYFGFRKLRIFLTLLFILIFNILTGLSISVMRASIMIAFVFTGLVLYRKSISLNALFGAALFILLFNPFAIFNIGFQFSFITVLFLLVCGEKVLSSASRRKRVKFFFLSLIATSCIAMISTAIISGYYFHSISWVSIISNIILLPILPFYMVIGIIHIVLLIIGIDFALTNYILNAFYEVIHKTIMILSGLPISYTSGLYITLPEIVIYYAWLIFLAIWLHHNFSKKYLKISFLFFALFLTFHNLQPLFSQHSGISIFNSPRHTHIMAFANHKAVLWDISKDYDITEFQNNHKSFLAKETIHSITATHCDTLIRDAKFYTYENYALIHGKSFVVAPQSRKKLRAKTKKFKCDYLVVNNHYYGTISQLCKIYDFSHLILSGNIYDKKLNSITAECQSLNLKPIIIKDTGTFMILDD